MKILRLLRNLAALFILGAALLVSQSSAGRANIPKGCFFTTEASNCIVDSKGQCHQSKCQPGSPCSYTRCQDFCKKPCFI